MAVSIHDTCEPLSEKDIVFVEDQLGLKFPVEYVAFLLSSNGGYPIPNAFPIRDNPSDDQGLVHYFLCVQDDDVYNLMDWVESYRDRVPSGFIPIACDPGGNLICLSTQGPTSGNVYFWDHESEADEGQAPRHDNVFFVADSFQQFLESLAELEPDD